MDKERIKGAAQKIKGRVEKVIGKLVGNEKLESDGRNDEVAGSVRQTVGKAKDDVRDVVKKSTK